MKHPLLVVMVLAYGLACQNARFIPGEESNLSERVTVVPVENRFEDASWNIWCGSMVKGDDGKYHLFYSRWPRETRHEGWISHSEIAHAVAEHPNGPYRYADVALAATDSLRWDGAMTHNPYIIKHEGKFYLYYIGTKGKPLGIDERFKPYSMEWWKRRNTQRIGVAVSDSPFGPWKRMDNPLLSVSEDSTAFDAMCVTNPAVCVGRDGKFVMLYKAVCKNGTYKGGKVRFSVAFSDTPTGPFVKTHKLIFQPVDERSSMVAEDPFVWYDKVNDKYYAIVRDVVNQFTGNQGGKLALMVSDDAIEWKPAKYPKVLPPVLTWSDGTTYDVMKHNVERPFVFFDEEGKPLLLFGAFGVDAQGIRREHSFNACIPFNY